MYNYIQCVFFFNIQFVFLNSRFGYILNIINKIDNIIFVDWVKNIAKLANWYMTSDI